MNPMNPRDIPIIPVIFSQYLPTLKKCNKLNIQQKQPRNISKIKEVYSKSCIALFLLHLFNTFFWLSFWASLLSL